MKTLALSSLAILTAIFTIAGAPPASRPAGNADFSSPLAALRTSKAALKSGDAAMLKRTMYTADVEEQKAIDAIMDSFAAKVRFQEACATRFGPDAAERVAPGFHLAIPADAREEIEGDRATIFNIGGSKPTALRRVDGEWRFTYGSLVDNNFRDLPPMPPAKLAQVFQTSIDMYKTLCDDIAEGQFERIEDVMKALRTRQHDLQTAIRELIEKS